MADAAIGPVVSVATAAFKDVKAFSPEHRGRHESYAEDIDAVLDRIKPLEQDDELTYDQLDTLHELRKGSKTALDDYLDAIDEHAEASWWRPVRKIEKRREVKRMEREVRKSKRALRDYYDTVSSGSDASSMYAESGSPPESEASQKSRRKVEDWLPGSLSDGEAEDFMDRWLSASISQSVHEEVDTDNINWTDSSDSVSDEAYFAEHDSLSAGTSGSNPRRPTANYMEQVSVVPSIPPAQSTGEQEVDPRKKYKCNVCPRAFARAYNLKTHMATHDPSRLKPHVCPHHSCGRSFSRKHDLQRHLISIHRDEPV